MEKLLFNEALEDGLDNMIVVTGIQRSGTTIAGKTISSFDQVEYSYEPPLAYYANALLRLGEAGPEEALRWLRVYLYHDLFLNYQLGRNYNFRSTDDSCILNVKPYRAIVDKWQSIKDNATGVGNQYLKKARFSFKLPDVYALLPVLMNAFKGLKVVDMNRDLNRVFVSMMVKQYFSDAAMKKGSASGNLWPFFGLPGDYKTPSLVEQRDFTFWQTANAVSRTAYMCCKIAEQKLQFKKLLGTEPDLIARYREIPYEEMLLQPQTTFNGIADFLEVSWGKLTVAIVSEIKNTERKLHIEDLIAQCDPVVYARMTELNRQLGY